MPVYTNTFVREANFLREHEVKWQAIREGFIHKNRGLYANTLKAPKHRHLPLSVRPRVYDGYRPKTQELNFGGMTKEIDTREEEEDDEDQNLEDLDKVVDSMGDELANYQTKNLSGRPPLPGINPMSPTTCYFGNSLQAMRSTSHADYRVQEHARNLAPNVSLHKMGLGEDPFRRSNPQSTRFLRSVQMPNGQVNHVSF